MDFIPRVGLLLLHLLCLCQGLQLRASRALMTFGTRAACSWCFTAGNSARAKQTGHGSQRHSDSQQGHQTSATLARGTRAPGKGTGTEQLVPGCQDTRPGHTKFSKGARKAVPTPQPVPVPTTHHSHQRPPDLQGNGLDLIQDGEGPGAGREEFCSE